MDADGGGEAATALENPEALSGQDHVLRRGVALVLEAVLAHGKSVALVLGPGSPALLSMDGTKADQKCVREIGENCWN